MPQTDQKKFLTTEEVAELLSVNKKMIYTLINDKGLPGTKVTGKWLFPRRTVEEWLEAHITHDWQGEQKQPDSSLILVSGSDDPLFQETINLFHNCFEGTTIFYANIGSMGGLKSLRRGQCHIGVCHLLQTDQEEYNFNFVTEEFKNPPVLVNFSKREQGLLIKKGNPKNISGIEDLARQDIRITNRAIGTGTRLLLDYEINKSKIQTKDINGYSTEVSKHIDAGLEVIADRADAAPAIRAIAGLLNLDFIPLRWERFDLLITKENFFNQNIQNFLSLLHEDSFRKLSKSYIGYDTSLCGRVIYPKQN